MNVAILVLLKKRKGGGVVSVVEIKISAAYFLFSEIIFFADTNIEQVQLHPIGAKSFEMVRGENEKRDK